MREANVYGIARMGACRREEALTGRNSLEGTLLEGTLAGHRN